MLLSLLKALAHVCTDLECRVHVPWVRKCVRLKMSRLLSASTCFQRMPQDSFGCGAKLDAHPKVLLHTAEDLLQREHQVTSVPSVISSGQNMHRLEQREQDTPRLPVGIAAILELGRGKLFAPLF